MILAYGSSLAVFVIFLVATEQSNIGLSPLKDIASEQDRVDYRDETPVRNSRIEAALEAINGRLDILLTGHEELKMQIEGGFKTLKETLAEIKGCLNCSSLTCPKGYSMYEKYKYGAFCYRYSNQCKSWSDARNTCQNEGGDLMIPDVCTYQFFRELAKSNAGKCEHFWIGGYTNTPGTNYITVNGDPIDSTFPYWSSGQPDGLGGESCCEMRSYFSNYLMNDFHCDISQGFICQIFP